MLLFDLNGFKRFNDTFGHPAGDELLAELGGRLRAAVGDDGFAYRFGGDEFCVVLTRAEQERRRAHPGGGDRADRSAGTASTSAPPGARRRSPPRPTARSEAMQLADLRMYAQKESRRASRRPGRRRSSTATRARPSSPR